MRLLYEPKKLAHKVKKIAVVEVFRTNIQKAKLAKELTNLLYLHFPEYKINFDLQDCDKILRVEGQQIWPDKIMELIHSSGYDCQPLE